MDVSIEVFKWLREHHEPVSRDSEFGKCERYSYAQIDRAICEMGLSGVYTEEQTKLAREVIKFIRRTAKNSAGTN